MMRALAIACVVIAGCGGSYEAHRDPAVASQAPMRREPPSTGSERARPSEGASGSERASTSEGASPSESASAPESPGDEWAHAPTLETIEGRVSFYADSLAGHRTANGEAYDPTALTCASRELPFGTLIRVVRPDTGASVVVRVNDRGPWGRRTRILDLSRAAAEALGMIRDGVVTVHAEIVRRGP
jgi:rare lipoprotein A